LRVEKEIVNDSARLVAERATLGNGFAEKKLEMGENTGATAGKYGGCFGFPGQMP
jgi:hypothetical protein